MAAQTKLIFVYNLKSSLFDQIIDNIHRQVSPHTYPCRLCQITYTSVGMKKEWQDFINNLPYPVEFLHKDKFLASYPKAKYKSFPAVFEEKNRKLKQLISTEEILPMNDLSDLKKLILSKVWIEKS